MPETQGRPGDDRCVPHSPAPLATDPSHLQGGVVWGTPWGGSGKSGPRFPQPQTEGGGTWPGP